MPPTRPRSNSESATEAGPAPAAKPHKKKMRKQERRDADAAAAAAALATALANTSPEMEEGELDEGPLFFVDDTPAAVPAGEAFMIDTVGDFPALAERNAPDDDANALGSDEALRIFAGEVQATSDEESSDEEENEVGEQVVFTLDGAERHLASTEADLRRAIEGKIVDDSAAQVTGRYYKEADLTKSCALCGEQGHSSRDCTHTQCYTCGEVDANHEMRNCPVSMICGGCGSRGHFARDCFLPRELRYPQGQRCALCQSTVHNPPNCPSLWRIYDLTGAEPKKKAKIVFACANDGSTKDHFIDDCPLPRGHPMRYVDGSAFNRDALGDLVGPAPTPSGGLSGGRGSRGQRAAAALARQEEPDEDDWFASRRRGDNPGGGGAGAGGGGGRSGGGRSNGSFGGRGLSGPDRTYGVGGSGGAKRQHIHFGSETRDRFAVGGGYNERDGGGRSGGRGRAQEADKWETLYGREEGSRSYKDSPRDGRGSGGRGGAGAGGGTRRGGRYGPYS